MATFGSDSFTDTDGTLLTAHTPEVGTWTKHPSGTGTASIKSNRLAPTNTTSTILYYNTGTPATAEYDVQADLFVVSTSVDEEWEILGRMSTSIQTYYMAEYYHGSAIWALYKCVSGSFTQLGTFSQTLSLSTSYTCLLQIRDAAKKVFVDGVQRISSSDNAITAAGKAGLMFDTVVSPTGGYYFDNWSASDPPSAQDTPELYGRPFGRTGGGQQQQLLSFRGEPWARCTT